jgi:hypothetical protein
MRRIKRLERSHLRRETDPAPEMLCSLEYRMMGEVKTASNADTCLVCTLSDYSLL